MLHKNISLKGQYHIPRRHTPPRLCDTLSELKFNIYGMVIRGIFSVDLIGTDLIELGLRLLGINKRKIYQNIKSSPTMQGVMLLLLLGNLIGGAKALRGQHSEGLGVGLIVEIPRYTHRIILEISHKFHEHLCLLWSWSVLHMCINMNENLPIGLSSQHRIDKSSVKR